MDEIHDGLAARAQRARASLVAESARHPVPLPSSVGGPRRARLDRGIPVLAGLVVVGITVGLLVASSWRSQSVVVPNVMSTVSAGSRPVAVVTDGGSTFVADAGPGTVTAFSTAKLSASWTNNDAKRPIALALGSGNLWVLDAGAARLLELDASDGHLVATAQTSLHPLGVTVTGTTVWVLSGGNETLDKYDATTATQTGSADLPAGGTSLTSGGGYVWVTASMQVVRVALDANRGTGVLSVPVADQPVAVAATPAGTWVALRSGELVDLDPGDPSRTRAHVATDATPTALTALGDGSAVVATTAGTLTRTGTKGQVSALPAPGAALASLASSGALLVGVSPVTALLYATEVPS